MQFQQAQVLQSVQALITCGWSRQSVNMHQLFNQPDARRERTRARQVCVRQGITTTRITASGKSGLNLVAFRQQTGVLYGARVCGVCV